MKPASRLTVATVLGLGMALGTVPLAVLAQSGSDAAADDAGGPGFRFGMMDTDGDGRVTREEMAARRAEAVAALDADSDGFLTAAEIAAFHLSRVEEQANAHAARMIERLDVDGDGRIGVAEMMVARGGAEMFDRMDANDDGALTREEMMQHRANRGGMGAWGHDGRRGGMDYNGHRDQQGDGDRHHGNHDR